MLNRGIPVAASLYVPSLGQGIVELAMRISRFQFTIGRLLIIIAICGVSFALLRTPFGFLVVLVAMVLPGFFLGRARGGSGVIAGAFSMSALTALLAAIMILFRAAHSAPSIAALPGILAMAVMLLFFAFVMGLAVSGALYLVFKLYRHVFPRDRWVELSDGIHWLPVPSSEGVPESARLAESSDGIRWIPPGMG